MVSVAVVNYSIRDVGGSCEFIFHSTNIHTTHSDDSARGDHEVEVISYFGLQPEIGDPLAG